MNDLGSLLLMFVLLGANAFFVGGEFSLISARRDRLEAMAEAGTSPRAAGVVLRATEHLSMMLAASQLGITLCSLALGALGEPAVSNLIEAATTGLHLPDALVHAVAFAISLLVVTVLHIVIGEMVPKNIAIAGPERTSVWLVPPLVAFLKVTRPVIVALNWSANAVLRVFGVTPKDEREVAFTPDELAEMLSESRREGLIDAAQTQRLTQTLTSAEHTVADVMVPRERATVLPAHPTVGAVEEAVARTGFSRYPVRAPEAPDAHPRLDTAPLAGGEHPVLPDETAAATALLSVELVGFVHVKDVLELGDDPELEIPRDRIRPLPALAVTAPVDEALASLRREGAHLGRALDEQGVTVGVVALEDLVEEYVGTVRDGTHVARGTTGPRQRPA